MPLTLKQHAYRVIREKLLLGRLAPGGRLSDDALAREMGISRSPVREAISQLATEGLVEHRPRSGAYVKAPDRQELEELYEIREALESHAAAVAAERIDADALADLQKLCRQMEAIAVECRSAERGVAGPELTERFLANDLAFHLACLRAAGNQRMVKLVGDFRIMTRVFGHVPVEHDLRVIGRSYRHHATITKAIARKDGRAARRWMRQHIQTARKVVLAGHDRQRQ